MTSLFEEADKGNPQRQRFNEGFDIGAKSHPHHLRIINDDGITLVKTCSSTQTVIQNSVIQAVRY